MKRYLEQAIWWDILFAVVVGVVFVYTRSFLGKYIDLPKVENINNFIVSCITVSATLIGFLLTIITVIVTFKKSFEDNSDRDSQSNTDFPTRTVFDKKTSKESQFYDTDIHKNVIDVFISAAFEIGVILVVLLLIQFNVFQLSRLSLSIISACSFLIIILSLIRSFYIFKLFLNVHVHNKTVVN